MSHEATTWATAQRVGSSPAKFTLFVLAGYADQEWSCFPSVKNLMKITEQGESTVRKALTHLVDRGFIKIFQRYRDDGSQRSSRYQLLFLGDETPLPDSPDWASVRHVPQGWVSDAEGGVQDLDRGGSRSERGGVQERPPIPYKEPSLEPSLLNPGASRNGEVVTGEIIDGNGALFAPPVGADLEVADLPNAGQLTRRWIDYCTEKDVKLTTSVIKRYGASVKQALADGFDDTLIRRALAAMLADRVASRPALFDSYLIRVQQGPEMPPARLTAHQADAERRAAEAGTTAAARLYDTLTRDA